MTDLAKVVRLEVSNERLTKARLARLAVQVQDCAEQTRVLLFPLIESCLDRLDDQLFSLADAAIDPKDQSCYFNAMRRVRQQRGAFLKRFNLRLQEAFASLDSSEATPAVSINADSLTLMRPEDLDELIAVEAMITQAHRAFSNEIALLSHNMDCLVETAVYARNNPAGPESLCQVVTSAALQLDIPAAIKLVLLKVFDEQVLAQLRPIYTALNELLKTAASSSGPNSSVARSSEAAITDKKPLQRSKTPMSAPANFDQELASVLTELAQGRERTAQNITREITDDVIVDLLSQLQPKMNISGVLEADKILEALRNYHGREVDFNRAQREKFSLVAVLFGFLDEDKHLPEAVGSLLSRLQIPLMKIALLDSDFFTHKGHPARRLLNELIFAVRSQEVAAGSPVLLKLKNIIATVVKRFDRDGSIFARLLEDFATFIETQRGRVTFAERRTIPTEDSKVLAEKAHKRVAVEVGLRTDGFLLTEPLREFVATVWFQVLFVRCLRTGSDTLPWRDGLQTLTDLVWSVQPLKFIKDRQALIAMVPGLMERLRLGLEEIGFDPFATADFFWLLNRLHRDSVAGFAIPPASEEKLLVNKDPAPADSASDTYDLHWQQVATFAPGAWFEIIEADKPVLRCRLAAVIKQTGKYIFVNRSGVKVTERDQHQLAQGLRTGQLRPIDSNLLFDRALEEVVVGLRKTKKSPLDTPDGKKDDKE